MSDSPYYLDDNRGSAPDRCERCGENTDGPFRLCDGCYSWQQHRRQHAHGSTEAWWLVLRLMALPEEIDPVRLDRILKRALDRYERRWKAAFVQPYVWPPTLLD